MTHLHATKHDNLHASFSYFSGETQYQKSKVLYTKVYSRICAVVTPENFAQRENAYMKNVLSIYSNLKLELHF
jgi:hypothetical protein